MDGAAVLKEAEGWDREQLRSLRYGDQPCPGFSVLLW